MKNIVAALLLAVPLAAVARAEDNAAKCADLKRQADALPKTGNRLVMDSVMKKMMDLHAKRKALHCPEDKHKAWGAKGAAKAPAADAKAAADAKTPETPATEKK